jgi:heme exporter protein D
MNMQTRPQGGFASNVWLQLALLAIAVVVLIGLASKYIW